MVDLSKNPLIRGSFIIFIGSIITGFGSYFFNIAMSRMLGPIDFGILASLLSLSYIFGVPAGTISTIIAKYTAQLNAKEDKEKISAFVRKVFAQSFLWSAITLVVLFALSPYIKSFLRLPSYWPLFIIGVSFALTFMAVVLNGALNGLERI